MHCQLYLEKIRFQTASQSFTEINIFFTDAGQYASCPSYYAQIKLWICTAVSVSIIWAPMTGKNAI
jgi:hypothetical protein